MFYSVTTHTHTCTRKNQENAWNCIREPNLFHGLSLNKFHPFEPQPTFLSQSCFHVELHLVWPCPFRRTTLVRGFHPRKPATMRTGVVWGIWFFPGSSFCVSNVCPSLPENARIQAENFMTYLEDPGISRTSYLVCWAGCFLDHVPLRHETLSYLWSECIQ